MNDKIYIVAGHVSEYTHWVKKNIDRYYTKNKSISLSNFVYVSGVDTLLGQRDVHGHFCGSFRNRPDLSDIVRAIRVCNNLPGNTQLIPHLYVGRGIISNSKQPYTTNVVVNLGGIVLTPFDDYQATLTGYDTIIVELTDIPPMGMKLIIQQQHGINVFVCDGAAWKFVVEIE